jgi:geranyl diphosphate synthase
MHENTITDPFSLIKPELNSISERIREGIVSEIPALHKAAGYFFQRGSEGKRLRPSICLLMGSALSAEPPSDVEVCTPDLRHVSIVPTEERRRQQRIAEIAELIHVASLLHDDVIDDAESRRGKPALNLVLGNKVAILAGDFLLARASMTLASLQNTAVVTLMSQILEDLVSGEVIQATAAEHDLSTMDLYLRKTYLKTASLMANASKATAVLVGASSPTCEAAYHYGKQLGLAFQVWRQNDHRPGRCPENWQADSSVVWSAAGRR